jgi:hypothetical protein
VTTIREVTQQRAAAEAARDSASVEALVARSLALRGTERDVAALLAAEAYRRWPDDPRSRSALMGTLTEAGGLLGSSYLDLDAPAAGARLPGTGLHMLATEDGRALLVGADARVRVEADLAWTEPETTPGTLLVGVSADGATGVVVRGVESGGRVTSELAVLDLPSLQQRGPVVGVEVGPGSVAVSPDGRRAAMGAGGEPALAVVDLLRGTVRERRLVPDGDASDWAPETLLAWTADDRLVVGGSYAALRVLEPSSLRVEQTVRMPPGSSNVAVSTDGELVVTSGSRRLALVDLETGGLRWSREFTVDHPAPCPWLAVSSRAGATFCGDWFGNLEQRDLRDGLRIDSLDPQLGSVGQLSVSSDGAELMALGAGAPAITRWRLDGSGPTHRLVASGSVVYEGYGVDGSTFVAARRPRGAREFDDLTRFAVWDPVRDRAAFRLPGPAGGVGWAGAGVLVGWSEKAGGIAFLAVDDGRWYRREPSLDRHDRSWPSPAGHLLYSGAPDGTVVLVDPVTGRRTGVTVPVGGFVNSLSESP